MPAPGLPPRPPIQSTRRYKLGLPGWLGSHSELLRSRPKRDSSRDPALSWEQSQQITQPQPLSQALLLGDLGPRTADTCPVFPECHLPRVAQELQPVIPRPWKCLGASDKGRRLTAGTQLLPCLLQPPFHRGHLHTAEKTQLQGLELDLRFHCFRLLESCDYKISEFSVFCFPASMETPHVCHQLQGGVAGWAPPGPAPASPQGPVGQQRLGREGAPKQPVSPRTQESLSERDIPTVQVNKLRLREGKRLAPNPGDQS